MATIPVDTLKLHPTQGQLALACQIAEGQPRETRGITHVPAAAYTDPAWFARGWPSAIWQASASWPWVGCSLGVSMGIVAMALALPENRASFARK